MPIIADGAVLVAAKAAVKEGDTVLVVGRVARLIAADGTELLAGATIRFPTRVPFGSFYATVPLDGLVLLREDVPMKTP